jgi:hypothetical protein
MMIGKWSDNSSEFITEVAKILSLILFIVNFIQKKITLKNKVVEISENMDLIT